MCKENRILLRMFATIVILINIHSMRLFQSLFVRADVSVSVLYISIQRAKVNDTDGISGKIK